MALFDKHILDNIRLDNYILLKIRDNNHSTFKFSDFIGDENCVHAIKFEDKIIEDWSQEFTMDWGPIYSLKIYPFTTCEDMTKILNCNKIRDYIIKIDLSHFQNNNIKFLRGAFTGCENLQQIIFGEAFSKPNLIDANGAFDGCKTLRKLDLSNVNFSNCTNMGWLFNYCYNLKTIIFDKNIDTSKNLNFDAMFKNCENLEEIVGFEYLKFDKGNSFDSMFINCKALKKLHFNNPNFENAVTFDSTFAFCKNLEEITGLENVNFEKVQIFNYMFSNCMSLKTLDMSNMIRPKAADVKDVFKNCNHLTLIKTPNGKFDISTGELKIL
jgi:hypothetical protein